MNKTGMFSKIKWAVLLIVGLVLFSVILLLMPFSFLRSKEKTIEVNGLARHYRIHTPKNYSEKAHYPLVIVLHAFKDNPLQIEIYTGMSNKADQEGFVVVYPKGTNSNADHHLSWNSGYCCGVALRQDVDDVNFISSLIDEIKKTYAVDAKRVYIVGFSNGGMLTYRLGAQLTHKITAIAVVAASIGGQFEDFPANNIPQPLQPLAVLALHGQKDDTVLYNGGINKKGDGNFWPVSQSIDFWVKNNKCVGQPTEENIKNGVAVKKSYSNCENNTRVVLYTIPNSGHVWFGGLVEIPKNLLHQSFSATDTVWDFLKNLSR